MQRHGTSSRRLEPRLAAVMSYLLGVMTGIILLRLERESRFVRFHALQSILYTAIAVVTLIAAFLAGLYTISYVLLLGFVSVWFYVMYRAARGDYYQLPIVGWWAERNA